MIVVTTDTIPGYRIVKVIGIVYGVSVRNRSSLGNFFSSIKTIIGGRQNQYIKMIHQTREEAEQDMMQEATQKGANAVVGVKVVVSEAILDQTPMEEVTIYGTAVVVEKE